MSVVLVCDLGGTSFRAALVDRTGAIRADCATVGPVLFDRTSWSEIDAWDWWSILLASAAQLAKAEPRLFAGVEGIAICGITRTQVFVALDGSQLRPAITWKDTRAEAAAARLREAMGSHPESRNLNAFHPLARLAWLREEESANFSNLACVLEPKDWLNYLLTGQQASDPVSMARLLACRERHDGVDALSAAAVADTVLPSIVDPQQSVGNVLSGLPAPLDRLAGAPVFCGSNDTWVAVVGLGALGAGYAYNISGTTEVLGMISDTFAEAEGLLTVDWRGFWQLGGPSQNGADTVAWLVALTGATVDPGAIGEAMATLLAGHRDPQPLLFLPYLQGERVPYWNPDLRGAFVGLNRRHRATDLAFAVLEGVAFLNRIVLERAEAALGRPAQEIRFGGGAAANPVWSQIKADVCGTPIVVGAAREPGLLGAAIVAWTGLGRFASLAEAQASLVTIARRFEPDSTRHATYDTLFALYRRTEAALSPISSDLARLALNPDHLLGIHARSDGK
ncbi:MAG: xylulokinase [Alsobacter sp.]